MENEILAAIRQFENRFNQFSVDVNSRFDALEHGFAALENRFNLLEQRFDSLEKRFDILEGRFDVLEGRFDRLEERFDAQEISTEKYFGAVNLEFVAVREEMRNGFEALRGEMRRGFAETASRKDMEDVLERVKRLDEDNTRMHSLDLHKRVRRIEKHLFEGTR